MSVVEAEPPTVVVFGGTGTVRAVTGDEVEEAHLFVRRGGIAALCGDRTFWQLLACGPVVVEFECHREAHAIIEAFAEAQRRLH
jgi:hypothetical protein